MLMYFFLRFRYTTSLKIGNVCDAPNIVRIRSTGLFFPVVSDRCIWLYACDNIRQHDLKQIDDYRIVYA